jgi:hypothetical protein
MAFPVLFRDMECQCLRLPEIEAESLVVQFDRRKWAFPCFGCDLGILRRRKGSRPDDVGLTLWAK